MYNVSIIVTCEEQQPQLRQMLPNLLSIRYEGEYEVIVVDEKHDKDMAEWLDDMALQYPHLHHTFCPATARGIDIHRLALTLGAKAANYEWLALLSTDAKLPDASWLDRLAGCIADGTDAVVGIADRKRRWNWFTSFFFRRRFSFFRPTPFILLCRRQCLLKSQVVKLSNRQIIKL